jgi:hypothetical protein
MRLIGALGSGETPTAAEASDGLLVLNQMLDSWLAERLMAFSILIQEFALTPGKQVYAMGPTGGVGDFVTARPVKIDRMSVVVLNSPSLPLELAIPILTDWDWQNVPVKNITSPFPTQVYDDQAFPSRNLSFWPVPTQVNNIRVYSWQQLASFPDLFTDLTFPPGYAEALRYNLARRLIAEMPGEYSQVTVSVTDNLATESLARVKSINLPIIEAFCDAALVNKGQGYYNFYDDLPAGYGNGR